MGALASTFFERKGRSVPNVFRCRVCFLDRVYVSSYAFTRLDATVASAPLPGPPTFPTTHSLLPLARSPPHVGGHRPSAGRPVRYGGRVQPRPRLHHAPATGDSLDVRFDGTAASALPCRRGLCLSPRALAHSCRGPARLASALLPTPSPCVRFSCAHPTPRPWLPAAPATLYKAQRRPRPCSLCSDGGLAAYRAHPCSMCCNFVAEASLPWLVRAAAQADGRAS